MRRLSRSLSLLLRRKLAGQKGSLGKAKRKLLEEAQTQPQQGAEPPPQQQRLQDDKDSPLRNGQRLRRGRFCFRGENLSAAEIKKRCGEIGRANGDAVATLSFGKHGKPQRPTKAYEA